MCDRCEVLERENMELRAALNGAIWLDRALSWRLQTALAITADQAALMALLWRTPPDVYVPISDLDAVMPGAPNLRKDPEFRTEQVVKVQIYRLRKRVGFFTIQSRYGLGYCLSAKGRILVQQALQDQP